MLNLIDVEKLKKGKYTLDELIVSKPKIGKDLGQCENKSVILKTGRYGLPPELISKLLGISNKLHNNYLIEKSNYYLRKGITEWIVKWKSNNWRTASKKPVANRDLWMEVDELSNTLNVEWHWIKGHDGDPGNERADYLANLGADSVS